MKFDDNADRRASVEVLQAQVDTTTNSISMVRIFDTDSDSGKLVIVDGTVLQWNDGSSVSLSILNKWYFKAHKT